MTVIAYSAKHRVMAADSRCTDNGGMHVTTCQKIFRLRNGALLGTSGESDDRDVRALLSRSKLPTRAQLAELQCVFQGILVFPKGDVYKVNIWYRDNEREWAGGVDEIRDPIVAAGCGADLAYGAMEFGATPQQAVELACRRHSLCAPPVQSEKLR